ncbi:MAG TPA: hypothetical protein EYN96_10145, partial [Candidatus Hydrogenedentes bacterium]|nr:hypothetical protein [Candidatus Hydrogenedentota bacterium]
MLIRFYAITLISATLILPNAYSAGFVAVYLDGASEGYNDPTVVTSDITGESTTLGADRRACLEAAMAVLETHLDITVDIQVQAEFNDLGGSSCCATLGGAGPLTAEQDFTNAPVSSTWFVQAQVNQLVGSDGQPGIDDISSQFNSEVDGTEVLGTTTWYYGIDGIVPANHIDFFSTAIHELIHGVGFLSLMDSSSGVLFPFSPPVFMDIFTSF